jgi:hypothetical protein
LKLLSDGGGLVVPMVRFRTVWNPFQKKSVPLSEKWAFPQSVAVSGFGVSANKNSHLRQSQVAE